MPLPAPTPGSGKRLRLPDLAMRHWLADYGQRDLADDLVAGMITAILLVPQSLAYAMLAGLPPEVGLYASILPLVAYGLFGSSDSLAVGPVAMISLPRFRPVTRWRGVRRSACASCWPIRSSRRRATPAPGW
mgnify:CR=1 FL=1